MRVYRCNGNCDVSLDKKKINHRYIVELWIFFNMRNSQIGVTVSECDIIVVSDKFDNHYFACLTNMKFIIQKYRGVTLACFARFRASTAIRFFCEFFFTSVE